MTPRAVVSLSGGQDSATAAAWAKAQGYELIAVTFDYGQNHLVEISSARRVAKELGVVEHEVLEVGDLFARIGPSALANPDAVPVRADATGTGNVFAEQRGLPSTFVPGRNIVLLGLAASWGVVRGATALVTGICAMDAAGYPDCRTEFAKHLQDTLRVGLDTPLLDLLAPLLDKTKAETWALAAELGMDELVAQFTHTCYEGDHTTGHEWGWGCGSCPACMARADGYMVWQSSLAG